MRCHPLLLFRLHYEKVIHSCCRVTPLCKPSKGKEHSKRFTLFLFYSTHLNTYLCQFNTVHLSSLLSVACQVRSVLSYLHGKVSFSLFLSCLSKMLARALTPLPFSSPFYRSAAVVWISKNWVCMDHNTFWL